MQFFLKTIITALVVAGVATLAKRLTLLAAILASLPLTSILAMLWLYTDTRDAAKVAVLSSSIFWAVLPSLVFFIVLPLLLNRGVRFGWAMLAASAVMVLSYTVYVAVLTRLGVRVH
jgi:uncharacterized membrane protein (GlpM family)